MKANEELKIKLRQFCTDKRAYYSLVALAIAFLITLPAELICNVRPLLLVVEGKPYFPILFAYSEKDFGGTLPSEPDYKSGNFLKLLNGGTLSGDTLLGDTLPQKERKNIISADEVEENILHLEMSDFEEEDVEEAEFSIGLEDFEEEESPSPTKQVQIPPPPGAGSQAASEPKEYWMIWPPVRYDYQYIPTESKTGRVVLAAPYESPSADGTRTIPSSWQDGHYLGTDDRGRDVLARLIYGFRVSMIFGLSLAITGTLLGCLLGGIQGFFGGWVDLIGQRLTEIWGSIPRLYILIILSAFLVPSPILLFAILNLTAWMGIAAYIRAEFLKTRNLEYVKAARALGVSDFKIMRKHILPNSLTPVITFFPFEVTAGILALVSLDFLNLGIPSPAPSIGELLAQGKNNLQARWILLPTFVMLTASLTLLTFVGDGIRNAFDPRKSV